MFVKEELHKNGKVKFRWTFRDENDLRLHSFNDEPAFQEFDSYGKLMKREWYELGSLNRLGLPAFEHLNSTGEVFWFCYYLHGIQHNDDDCVTYMYKHPETGVMTESWISYGKVTKSIKTNTKTNKIIEIKHYNENCDLHNSTLHFNIVTDSHLFSKLGFYELFKNGALFGISHYGIDKNGVEFKRFHLNGVEYTKQQIQEIINLISTYSI